MRTKKIWWYDEEGNFLAMPKEEKHKLSDLIGPFNTKTEAKYHFRDTSTYSNNLHNQTGEYCPNCGTSSQEDVKFVQTVMNI